MRSTGVELFAGVCATCVGTGDGGVVGSRWRGSHHFVCSASRFGVPILVGDAGAVEGIIHTPKKEGKNPFWCFTIP